MIFLPKFVADRNFWWQQKFIFWKVWTQEMRFAPSNASRTCFAAPLMVYAFGWYGDFCNFAIWPIGHFEWADIGRNYIHCLEIVVGDTLECKYPPELFPDALSCLHDSVKKKWDKSPTSFLKSANSPNFLEISGARSARQDFKNFIFEKYGQFPLFWLLWRCHNSKTRFCNSICKFIC